MPPALMLYADDLVTGKVSDVKEVAKRRNGTMALARMPELGSPSTVPVPVATDGRRANRGH